MKLKKIKCILCKALGDKEFTSARMADKVCVVRACIIGLNAITCLFIIYGVAVK